MASSNDDKMSPAERRAGLSLAAIFALVPLALTWRERDRGIDRWQFILMPLALALVTNGVISDSGIRSLPVDARQTAL